VDELDVRQKLKEDQHMKPYRKNTSAILLILGIAVYFSLLVFLRYAKLEWIGLLLIVPGVVIGYRSRVCITCHKKFKGIAVDPPPFCAQCGCRYDPIFHQDLPKSLTEQDAPSDGDKHPV
jgi:hypothetical protein